jgi:hypothetical protein
MSDQRCDDTLNLDVWKEYKDVDRFQALAEALDNLENRTREERAERDKDVKKWEQKIENANRLLEQAADAADTESERAKRGRLRIQELELKENTMEVELGNITEELARSKEQESRVGDELAEARKQLEIAMANASNWSNVRRAHIQELREQRIRCEQKDYMISDLRRKIETFLEREGSMVHSPSGRMDDTLNDNVNCPGELESAELEQLKNIVFELETTQKLQELQIRHKNEEIDVLKRSLRDAGKMQDKQFAGETELMTVLKNELHSMRESFLLKLKHKDELVALQRQEHKAHIE